MAPARARQALVAAQAARRWHRTRRHGAGVLASRSIVVAVEAVLVQLAVVADEAVVAVVEVAAEEAVAAVDVAER